MHDLSRMLDRARDAVLEGDFRALGPICHELEGLMATTDQLNAQEAQALRAKAERNMATLKAAMRGVVSAQRRLAELREAFSGHRTYGPGGKRSPLATLPGTMTQRV